MFDILFILPSNHLYRQLNLDPTATSADISNAINRRISELNKELGEIKQSQALVDRQIPELQEHQAMLSAFKNGDAKALAKLEKKVQELEEHALELNPNYKRQQARIKAIDSETLELNRFALNSAETRHAYDDSTSLFSLLELPSLNYGHFSDNEAIVSILRKDLSQFLENLNEDVFYPSDLARINFESEFSACHLLDGYDDKS